MRFWTQGLQWNILTRIKESEDVLRSLDNLKMCRRENPQEISRTQSQDFIARLGPSCTSYSSRTEIEQVPLKCGCLPLDFDIAGPKLPYSLVENIVPT